MINDWKTGDKARLTPESFQRIVDGNHSIKAYPSNEYVEKIRKYIGQECEIFHRHFPGYEITIRFSDFSAFYAKDNWVDKVETK